MVLIILPSFVFCHSNGQNKRANNHHIVNESFEADVDISLTAVPSEVQLFEGEKTDVYTYKAELIKGDKSSLQEIPNSYLGPIIRVKQNQKIRVRFNNELPDESIIH